MKSLQHTDCAVSVDATTENRSDNVFLAIYSLHNAQLIKSLHMTPDEAMWLSDELSRSAKAARKQKRK